MYICVRVSIFFKKERGRGSNARVREDACVWLHASLLRGEGYHHRKLPPI